MTVFIFVHEAPAISLIFKKNTGGMLELGFLNVFLIAGSEFW